MNETLKAIAERYTCRDYSEKMPSDEDLKAIALAGVQAPSGMNRQLWQVIVVKDQQLIADMDEAGMEVLAGFEDPSLHQRIVDRGGKLFYNAPCMIVIATGKATPAGAELFDCGIVAQNVVLAASSLGIASTHCGFAAMSFAGPRGAEFKERMQFPEGYEIGIAVLLGYEKNPGTPHVPDESKITWIG